MPDTQLCAGGYKGLKTNFEWLMCQLGLSESPWTLGGLDALQRQLPVAPLGSPCPHKERITVRALH